MDSDSSLPEDYFFQKQSQQYAKQATNQLSHVCQLDIDQHPQFVRQSNIICTMGPNTENLNVLRELITNGMNVARLNLTLGTYKYHNEMLRNIREVAKSVPMKPNIAIAIDISSPVVRTGTIDPDNDAAEIELVEASNVVFTINEAHNNVCTKDLIWIDNSYFRNIIGAIKVGDRIYLDDGKFSLIVREKFMDSIRCLVEQGGLLTSNVRFNIPRASVYRYAVLEKYRQSILYAMENEADFLYLSFIESGEDVLRVKSMLNSSSGTKIIVRVETRNAVKNIDSILKEADGICICRGDLAMDIDPEKVFLVQKSLISRCMLAQKPVMVAEQIMESMRTKPRPTRAEVSDVANAVLDGADGLVLGVETSKGKYPVEALKCMHSICREAESAIFHDRLFVELKRMQPISSEIDPTHTTAIAAVEASLRCHASAIIVVTTTGRSAFIMSSFRPICPILAVIRRPNIVRQCHLYRCVHPVLYEGDKSDDWSEDMDARINYALEWGHDRGFLNENNYVVIVTGWVAGPGSTNTVRIFTVPPKGAGLHVVRVQDQPADIIND